MRIYVATSWRNARQPEVVQRLLEAGHEVYDFRHPAPDKRGFAWSELDPEWQRWNAAQFRAHLDDERAVEGYRLDYDALAMCDACVLVQPCGRSAHLEAGYAVGAELPVFVLLEDGQEPELMLKLAEETDGALCLTLDEIVKHLDELAARWQRNVELLPTRNEEEHDLFVAMLSELGPGEVVEAIQAATTRGIPRDDHAAREKALTDLCVDVFRRGAACGYELALDGLPPPVTQDDLAIPDHGDGDDVVAAEAAVSEVAERDEAEHLRGLLRRLVNRLPEGEELVDVLCRDDDDRETAGELLDEVLEVL